MKTIQFIFSVLVGVMMLGCSGQSIVAAEAAVPIEEMKQWHYVKNSLDQDVAGAQKTLPIVEKVLKYGVAPVVPLALIWADGFFEAYKLDKLFDAECLCSSNPGWCAKKVFFMKAKALTGARGQDIAALFFALCAGALAVSAGLYVLTDKIFAAITSSQNHDALKNLLVDWHTHRDQIPASLLPLVDKLYSNMQAGKLTADQSNKALAAFLAMSAVSKI